MPRKVAIIPFRTIEEIEYHLSCSQALLDMMIVNIRLMDTSNKESYEEIEKTTIKSLKVLNEGFANIIKSLKEGQIK